MITLLALLVLLQVLTIILIQQKNGLLIGSGKREAIIDSCVLIDGRILELVKTGFVPARLVVPHSVMAELQYMADGSNHQKRHRARYGLEVMEELKDNRRVDLLVLDDSASDRTNDTEVDEQLLQLAQKRGCALMTIDYNLIKVAELRDIEILNINELAKRIRPAVLPGEKLDIKIAQKGAEKGQGVGHSDDGVMIVVDGAAGRVGKTVEVEVTRTLQTSSGRMLFARLVPSKGGRSSKKS